MSTGSPLTSRPCIPRLRTRINTPCVEAVPVQGDVPAIHLLRHDELHPAAQVPQASRRDDPVVALDALAERQV